MKNGFATTSTRVLLAGLTLSLSATAFAAGSINYDFRVDYDSQSFDSDAIPSSSRFVVKTGRLDFKGDLNESLKYEARWAMNKPATASATTTSASNQTRDSLNNSVELLFITHKMSDMFSLSIGKFNTEVGGFEGAASGADLYLISPIYSHVAATATPGTYLPTSASSPNLLYMTGVKGIIALGETQTLSLIATNNTTDAAEGANFNQNRGMLGAVYKGAFFDKTWVGWLGYHEVSPQANGAAGAAVTTDKDKLMSVGVKYDLQPLAAILEYQTSERNQTPAGAFGSTDRINEVIAKIGYTIDQWTPRLEAFTAQEDLGIASSVTNRYTGLGAVLEYKPTADNFRYHVAYTSVTNHPAGAPDVTRGEIMVGARLFGDFLK